MGRKWQYQDYLRDRKLDSALSDDFTDAMSDEPASHAGSERQNVLGTSLAAETAEKLV